MPGLEQMMNAFAFDQSAGKNDAKLGRSLARFESIDIDTARQVEQLRFREIPDTKRFRGFLRKDDDEIGQLIFFDETLAIEQQSRFPRCRVAYLVGAHFPGRAVAMPGRDLNKRRNLLSLCDTQRLQTIARPTMKKIVTPGFQLSRRDPIEVFLFCPVVIRPIEKRDQPHRMPPQRMDISSRNFTLPIGVGNGFSEKTLGIGGAESFKRIGIESVPANSRKNRVEQALRQPATSDLVGRRW